MNFMPSLCTDAAEAQTSTAPLPLATSELSVSFCEILPLIVYSCVLCITGNLLINLTKLICLFHISVCEISLAIPAKYWTLRRDWDDLSTMINYLYGSWMPT